MNEAGRIMIDERDIGSVEEFSYLGSLITADSNFDKEVKMSIR